MPINKDSSAIQIKSKNFDEELRSKLKDRKKRGLTTGLSDTTGGESDSADSDSLDGGAGGDDLLAQFGSTSKRQASFGGSSKPWAPPVGGSRQKTSPIPSPRGLRSPKDLPPPKGLPSPRGLTSPKASPRGLPSPISHPRTQTSDKLDGDSPRRRLSKSPDRLQKEVASTPQPKPRSHTNTDESIPSSRRVSSSKLKESPRMKSERSEVDDLLGLAPLKPSSRKKDQEETDLHQSKPGRRSGDWSPESRQKIRSPSIVDELLRDDSKSKTRSKSPEAKNRSKSPEPRLRSKIQGAEESPVSSRKIRRGSTTSSEAKSRKNSVLDNLLGNGEKTKSRSGSPEPKGRSRSPSILDDLLNNSSIKKSEARKQHAEPDSIHDDLLGLSSKPKSRSGSPVSKPKPKARDASPSDRGDKLGRRRTILDSDGSDEGKEGKSKRKPPTPKRGSPKGGSPSVRRKGLLDSSDEDEDAFNRRRTGSRSGHRSPSPKELKSTNGKRSPIRKGLLDSSDNDSDKMESKPKFRSRSPSPKGSKTSVSFPKPRTSSVIQVDAEMPAEKKKGFRVDDFLDSGSDVDDDEDVDGGSGRPSLLDVLGGDQRPKSKKKKKKSTRKVLGDSDYDSDKDDIFKTPKSSKKKPPVISGRRPKEGYQSADEEDVGSSKGNKIAKPIPRRPVSSVGSTGGRDPLDSSLNGSVNVQDSSSIRQAIYEEWRVQKQEIAEQRAREEKKKEKEETKRKEKELQDKRSDAASSFNAWKGSKKDVLKKKSKEEAMKKEKAKEEEEKEMMKKMHAEKAFEVWKVDKDEHLKEQHKKKVRGEHEKTQSKDEEKEMKSKDAQSAYKKWKSVKDDKIIDNVREKMRAEEAKKREEEDAQKRKEQESLKAYNDWERKTERRKEKDKKRLAQSQPISTMPFRPSGHTVQFGR